MSRAGWQNGLTRFRGRNTTKTPQLLRYGDENIDPFSFIYSLAAHHHARRRVYASVGEAFDLTRELPLDLDEAFTFPMPPLVTALFHNRGSGNPGLLWRLFRSAVEGIDTVSDEDFMLAQAISGVAVKKLTQALFLINARQFLPYDDWTLSLGVVEGGRANPVAWNDYRSDLAELLEAFPGCMPYEIDLLAYETRRSDLPLKLDPTRCWQISTNVYNDGMDRWDDFELNNCAYTGGPGKRQGSWREYDAENHELAYKVHEPRKGDIILVRFAGLGHGIGAIYRNDYTKSFSEKSRLHVLWLCKRAEQLSSGPRAIGFGNGDGAIGDAFRTAYPETYRFWTRCWPKAVATPQCQMLKSHSKPHRSRRHRLSIPSCTDHPGQGRPIEPFRVALRFATAAYRKAENAARDTMSWWTKVASGS